MKNAIFYTFLSISIALSIWALCSTYFLSNRLQQNNDLLKETRKSFKEQNRDSLNDEIIKLKFEKSSYTELLDAQSNLTIGYVTLLFALFGITGLVISNRLAKDIKVDYQEEKSKIQGQFRAYRVSQERKYITHRDEILSALNNFKTEFTESKHLLYSNLGAVSFLICEINPNKKGVVFRYSINGAEWDKKAYDIEPDPVVKANIVFSVNRALSVINDEQNDVAIKNILEPNNGKDFKEVQDSISIISQIDNDEVKLNCSKISVRLSELFPHGFVVPNISV